jgi:hypothetical protein
MHNDVKKTKTGTVVKISVTNVKVFAPPIPGFQGPLLRQRPRPHPHWREAVPLRPLRQVFPAEGPLGQAPPDPRGQKLNWFCCVRWHYTTARQCRPGAYAIKLFFSSSLTFRGLYYKTINVWTL